MEDNNDFLTTIREAEKINKEDEEAYINKYKEFAKLVKSGKFKIQGENEEK